MVSGTIFNIATIGGFDKKRLIYTTRFFTLVTGFLGLKSTNPTGLPTNSWPLEKHTNGRVSGSFLESFNHGQTATQTLALLVFQDISRTPQSGVTALHRLTGVNKKFPGGGELSGAFRAHKLWGRRHITKYPPCGIYILGLPGTHTTVFGTISNKILWGRKTTSGVNYGPGSARRGGAR